MSAAEMPLDLAADLTAALAPDGEQVDPAIEVTLPDWDAELDEEPPRRRWRVDSDERADYACRRVMLEDEAIARVRHFAAEQIRQIEEWAAERVKTHESARAFFIGSATDYARRLRQADDSFRTLPLPCGWKLTAHDGRAGVDVIGDGEEFCAWALNAEHDDVVKVTLKPKLAEIAKRYRVAPDGSAFVDPETGEQVPGLVPRRAGWTAAAKPPKSSDE